MQISRRSFLGACALTAYQGMRGRSSHADEVASPTNARTRSFHVCLNHDALAAYPDLLDIMADVGMDKIWVPAFFYGFWPYDNEARLDFHRQIEARGMSTGVINIPLGHPGDSLGAMQGDIPLTPPEHWQMGHYPDGRQYSGTSLHPPATEENVEAMRRLAAEGAKEVFLDDDFRLAVSPGMIGGCFCDAHKQAFLESRGFGEEAWEDLMHAVQQRQPTRELREWVEFTCDALTDSFRQQQAAAPDVAMGNMVMYFGSEKAGIRLADYKDALFRVGESKFNDAVFTPVKGKTDALFSCLFHRRYAQPELAYSETTAYPADQLSAQNIAAKLAITTIADVRNTMFMSGLTPYPIGHWDTIGPAMRHNAVLHAEIAGHRPQGPLKHYWGAYSRLVGNDDPYSLFLAMGLPFEVCDAPAADGWTFLSDADAHGLREEAFEGRGAQFIARHDDTPARALPEDLEALFALKREILPELDATVPHVVEDLPVVCAWYPEANAVLLWNLSESVQRFTLRCNGVDREVPVDALDIALVSLSA